jgi:HPt (histidine-containing phosphotransfer) domain-containing protein
MEENLDINIPGIDIEKGLYLYGGKHKIYIDILRAYVECTPAYLNQLRKAAAETLDEYHMIAHSLKGSSAGIGAEHLREVAAGMEASARNGDAEAFLAQVNPFADEAFILIENINEWLKEYDANSGKPCLTAPDRNLLKKLRQSCEEYDIMGIDVALDELERYEYETGADLVSWLRQQTIMMELDEIIARLVKE